VEFPRRNRVETEIKLVLPTEFEPCFREGIVAILRTGVALGEVGSVGGNFVGDHPVFDVLPVRQAKVFLRSDVA
jgi:hypothetical protein